MDSLRKCIAQCTDKLRVIDVHAASPRLVRSHQRGTYIVQVVDRKQVICQVTDIQFGSAARADAAAAVLCELYSMGASRADLQRCKLAGCLFGVRCGQMRQR